MIIMFKCHHSNWDCTQHALIPTSFQQVVISLKLMYGLLHHIAFDTCSIDQLAVCLHWILSVEEAAWKGSCYETG